ncbi:hypothetical protein AGMMS50229_09760 [Campylobacterota bacterium]|nr:hypothetical protein AGMMS50229_09760 [Campylobacterota bacterium]
MTKEDFAAKYASHMQTLEDISEKLCFSLNGEKYLKFDEITVAAFPKIHPCAFDLIHFYKDFIICVEFKNRAKKSIITEEESIEKQRYLDEGGKYPCLVKDKLREGLLALYSLFDGNLPELHKRVIYVVIHKDTKTLYSEFADHTEALADEFRLSKYKKWLIYDTFTMPCNDTLKHKMSRYKINIK